MNICECGQLLPEHIRGIIVGRDQKHVCSCHRLYKVKEGRWQHVGFERNPIALLKMAQPQPKEASGTEVTEPGDLWVCSACGKVSLTLYGFDAKSRNMAQSGWDESCMLNAVLMRKVGE